MSVIPLGFFEAVVRIRIPSDAGPAMLVIGGEDGLATTNAQAIATAYADVLNNNPGLVSMLAIDTFIESVTVYANIGGPDLAIGFETVEAQGQNGNTAASPQVAALVQKLSGLAGRRNRGRMFTPSPSDDGVGATGLISGPVLAAMQTGMDAFLSDLDTLDVPMKILHTDPAFAPTDVTLLEVSNRVATQRRRLR